METIYSLYKITNIVNGKSYIGWTSLNPPQKRFRRHITDSLSFHDNLLFHKAIRKYGPQNFIFEVICQSKDENYIKNVLEPMFIKKLNTYGKKSNGYNLTPGGEGRTGKRKGHSLETRLKMKEKAQDRNKKKFEIIFNTGIKKEIFGLSSFCREFDYSLGALNQILSGKQFKHKNIIGINRL